MYGGRSNEALVNRLQDGIAPLRSRAGSRGDLPLLRQRSCCFETAPPRRAEAGVAPPRARPLLTFRIVCCSSMRTWTRFLGMSNVGRTACCRCYEAKRSISSAGCHRLFLRRRTLAPTWQLATCSHGFDVVLPDSAGNVILSPNERHPDQSRHSLEHWLTRSPAALQHSPKGSRELTNVVRAMSETTSAQANLRLQRQLAFLTWVLIALAIVTLFR